jgi:hypothetical protein
MSFITQRLFFYFRVLFFRVFVFGTNDMTKVFNNTQRKLGGGEEEGPRGPGEREEERERERERGWWVWVQLALTRKSWCVAFALELSPT